MWIWRANNNLKRHCRDACFIGIDLSKNMIKVGKEFIANKKIKFYHMSAEKMSFNNESFDYILSKDSFHHFKDPVKVLKEMYRVLKKGGIIYSIDLRRDVQEDVFFQTIQLASGLNVENAILYMLNQAEHLIRLMK
jgi:ubiquinone/menaquinone biosynthesis C-methylase UbiE